jgi:hypothetical protein
MYREGLAIAKFGDPDFIVKLEHSIKNGKAFLLENVQEWLDPLL